ncbi:MAG: hypothetical protein ACMG6E_10820 [Candidatus Roizmanbacteria bacterium]
MNDSYNSEDNQVRTDVDQIKFRNSYAEFTDERPANTTKYVPHMNS